MLIDLNLNNNNLTDFDNNNFGMLRTLSLNYNKLSKFNKQNLSNLAILNLASNRITEFNENDLPNILSLNLNFNNITNINSSNINKNIEVITIESNDLESFNTFSQLTQIKRLNFEANYIGEIKDANLPHL